MIHSACLVQAILSLFIFNQYSAGQEDGCLEFEVDAPKAKSTVQIGLKQHQKLFSWDNSTTFSDKFTKEAGSCLHTRAVQEQEECAIRCEEPLL